MAAILRQFYLLKFAITVILLILQTEYFKCHAFVLKCPLYQMHIQKIIGFRPPLEYLHETHLIYSPVNNFKNKNRRPRDAGYAAGTTQATNFNYNYTSNYSRSRPHQVQVPSAICWRICNDDTNCLAYVHLLDTNECYGYTLYDRTRRYPTSTNEMPLVADAEAIFYEKICLKVPDTCKSRLWALTKIPGSSLLFQGKKVLPMLVTRRECAEKCLFESEFNCLSASFAPSYRNIRERTNQHAPTSQQQAALGRCTLSDRDKMTQPDAFRTAPFDEEYIENHCYERAIENDHCSYEFYSNSSFVYAEAQYVGLTQKECQSYCTHESHFYCQGVSFYYENNDLRSSECSLHSEDIISMGPRSLRLRASSIYMRRVKCLDIQVVCTHDEMAIKYTPKDYFNGKMYASSHSRDCSVQGNGTQRTLLRLAIGTETKENRCGVIRAYEMTKDYQRIFISALIVIQNNMNVQTQGDRLIKVGCIISNATAKQQRKQTDDEEEPNAIALESTLQFTKHVLPHEGPLHFNAADLPAVPKITLQIIDLSHQHQTNDVQIGQNLELQIVGEYTPHQQALNAQLPPVPDFRATSLVARTQDNQNYVLLIDERGCPTDMSVFPALERLRTHSKTILRARFHAFKFTGTSMVNFDVKIHFCQSRCPESNCLQYGGSGGANSANKEQHTRSKREVPMASQSQLPTKVQNPVYISTVMDIAQNRSEDANSTLNATTTADNNDELPLNYNLNVRGPDKVNSNSFIYGERGILLIAGIDDQLHLDNVCLNQSLLIALLIFWIIVQVALVSGCCYIYQKYRNLVTLEEERRKMQENFDYWEGRRVHWADESGYTL